MKRIQSVLERKPLDFKDMGPCGGFSIQYACYCDYYSMPYREEVSTTSALCKYYATVRV
jgi:hypothetical protein